MQMGYTRARRYANHKGCSSCILTLACRAYSPSTGGKKYETVDGVKTLIPRLDVADQAPDKVRAAEIFAAELKVLQADSAYAQLRVMHEREWESKELNLDGIEVVRGVPAVRGGQAKGGVGKKRSRVQ
jgi:hypothetical protein